MATECKLGSECFENKKKRNRLVSFLLVATFSAVLFINNVSDLFDKLGWYYQIQWVAWLGIIGSFIYALWKAVNGEFGLW